MSFIFTMDPSKEQENKEVYHDLIPYRFFMDIKDGKVGFFFGSLLSKHFRPYTIKYNLYVLNARGNRTQKKFTVKHTYKYDDSPCWGYAEYWKLSELAMQDDGKLKCLVKLEDMDFGKMVTKHVGLIHAMLTSRENTLLEANRNLEREKTVLLNDLKKAKKRSKLNESLKDFKDRMGKIISEGTIEDVNRWTDVLKETMVTLGERKVHLEGCVLCKVKPRRVVCIPCAHLCVCEDCKEHIKDTCPICEKSIESTMVPFK